METVKKTPRKGRTLLAMLGLVVVLAACFAYAIPVMECPACKSRTFQVGSTRMYWKIDPCPGTGRISLFTRFFPPKDSCIEDPILTLR